MRIIATLVFTFTLFSQTSSLGQDASLKKQVSLWLKPNSSTTALHPVPSAAQGEEALYFNFNPILKFAVEKVKSRYGKMVNNKASFFLAFQSKGDSQPDLITISNIKSATLIGSGSISEGEDKIFYKGNPGTGIVLSYLFNKSSIIGKKKGTLTFSEALAANDDGSQKLCELLYFPRVVTEVEKNATETYLSLKYGISLAKGHDYTLFDGRQIWKDSANEGYDKRVTGIGRDDFTGLLQKQSQNAERDGLTIGFTKIMATNAANVSSIADGTFCLWADNGKDLTIAAKAKQAGTLRKMKRIWKFSSVGAASLPKLQFVFETLPVAVDKPENQKSDRENLWLVIDTDHETSIDYETATYITSSSNGQDGKFLFDDVEWKAGMPGLFTFVKAPDFFVLAHYEKPECGKQSSVDATLRLIGGKAPYKVDIYAGSLIGHFDVGSNQLELPSLASGAYTFVCTDATGKLFSGSIAIDAFGAENTVSMNSEWYLDKNEIDVTPTLSDPESPNHLSWYHDGKLLGTGVNQKITAPGRYTLVVSNGEGCEKEIPFSVFDEKKVVQANATTYPNPVSSGTPFAVSIVFGEKARVTLSVFDLGGRQIRYKDYGDVSALTYEDTILVSGTYMIVCHVNGVPQTSKLIVN